ncbi:hypothetical protein [Gynuella sunshinyii]|uniref:Uncharacterized protein n=1 Tax=Gynuella sunshinyii YC6258 TaxID=1445510 RepID=A0A0C5VPX6_9GAMM|nr:hypothetical protein [Gynuella sunshinyii]AJQ96261.1 hypothetical Protein YC6258_04227 [Gynuella sunshinyii YC6258]
MKTLFGSTSKPQTPTTQLQQVAEDAGLEARAMKISLAKTYLVCEQIELEMRQIRLRLERAVPASQLLSKGSEKR